MAELRIRGVRVIPVQVSAGSLVHLTDVVRPTVGGEIRMVCGARMAVTFVERPPIRTWSTMHESRACQRCRHAALTTGTMNA